MTKDGKMGGKGYEEAAVRLAFGVLDHFKKRGEDRRREEAAEAVKAERAAKAAERSAERASREAAERLNALDDAPGPSTAYGTSAPEDAMRENIGATTSDEARTEDDGHAREEPRRDRRRRPIPDFDTLSGIAGDLHARYGEIRDKAGVKVTEVLDKGAAAFDRRAGDVPWQILGLDERDARVAREVMTEIVPDVVGTRVTAFVDGVAVRGGMLGAGAALRMPLRAIGVPLISGLAAMEAARAVREIRDRAAEIGGRIDDEEATR